MKKKTMVDMAVVVAVVAVALWLVMRRVTPAVNDFASCVAAGNPVKPVDPGICSHHGKSYVDDNPPMGPGG